MSDADISLNYEQTFIYITVTLNRQGSTVAGILRRGLSRAQFTARVKKIVASGFERSDPPGYVSRIIESRAHRKEGSG